MPAKIQLNVDYPEEGLYKWAGTTTDPGPRTVALAEILMIMIHRGDDAISVRSENIDVLLFTAGLKER